MDQTVIDIPRIVLEWSEWYEWERIALDARSPAGVHMPREAGVYEARKRDTSIRLTIGKASNLRLRVRRGLVKGKVPHSAGERIRSLEDTSQIVVRWAVTDRDAAVEEELHRLHAAEFGRPPLYTRSTR